MKETWSLDNIYKGYDDPKYIEDEKKLDEVIEEMNNFNIQDDDKANLSGIIDLFERQYKLVYQMSLYNELRQSVNCEDNEAISKGGILSQKTSSTSKCETRLKNYIASLENLEDLISSDDKLKEYEYLLKNIKEDHKYDLSEEVEEALSLMNISGGDAWSALQANMTAKVKVEYRDETITLSQARALAYDGDENVRKDAYEAELKAYEKIEDAVAYSLNSIKMQASSDCKLRGFDSVLDKTLHQSRMKKETLDAMYEAINEYLPKFHAYLKAKARYLGHDNGLPWYDLFAPVGKNDKIYTLEEAKDYLLDTFKDFNPKLHEIVKRAFDEQWIDFLPHEGKVGGAFCASSPLNKEFRILTNFTGTFSDIDTLAHELGHGYHDFMVQDNAILNQDYSMPVAESASTFNENVIMHKALENCDDKMVKLNLLDSDISGNCQLMCDIYSRFLFESEVCERRVNEFLSADELKKIMLNAQKKAYGDGLDSDCLHPYMWLCKGHYYNAGYNFYNFPYAFGGLFSRGLYEMYVKEGPAFLDKYNEMLRLTPVKSVEDAAMVAGIDVTKPDFYRDTLEAMSKDIDMFIELCESV